MTPIEDAIVNADPFETPEGEARLRVVGYYAGGYPAVQAVLENGEVWGTLSLRMDGLGPDEMAVKTWTENEGWWRKAVDAAGLQIVRRVPVSQWSTAVIVAAVGGES